MIGANLFIGSLLAEMLVNNGAEVKAIVHNFSLTFRIEQVEGILAN